MATHTTYYRFTLILKHDYTTFIFSIFIISNIFVYEYECLIDNYYSRIHPQTAFYHHHFSHNLDLDLPLLDIRLSETSP